MIAPSRCSGRHRCSSRAGWRPRSLNPVYLHAGGFLFAYEISFALSLGLAEDRSQALELAMINYLWPCLMIVLAVGFGQQRGSLLLAPGVALCLLGASWLVAGQGGWSGRRTFMPFEAGAAAARNIGPARARAQSALRQVEGCCGPPSATIRICASRLTSSRHCNWPSASRQSVCASPGIAS